MQAQANYIQATWSSARGVGGHRKFTSAKKNSADIKEFRNIIASKVAKSLKVQKKSKSKPKENSNMNIKPDHITPKNMDIGDDSYLE